MGENKDFVVGVHKTVERVLEKNLTTPGEQERLLKKPIDILCFGRAGIGKTTLLEALSGRNLGSTPKLDHGTQKLEAIDIQEILPKKNGDKMNVNIRFLDTKGIDKWNNSNDVVQMMSDLQAMNVEPICILYCATANGRVESRVVIEILQMFFGKKIPIFYVITNIYAQSQPQLEAQIEGGNNIMSAVTSAKEVLVGEMAWKFHEKGYLIAVNSKEFISTMGKAPPKNVQFLMELCVSTLNEEQLTQFFLATLYNRTFWDKAADKFKTVVNHLKESVGIDVRSFLQTAWINIQNFINNFLF